MLKEFKDFIMIGNVIELFIVVILGVVLGGVVFGFINDVMMLIVGYFIGGMDFFVLKVVLFEVVVDVEGNVIIFENVVLWGKWVNVLINFVIVGFVLFLIVKVYNKIKKKKEEVFVLDLGLFEVDLLKEIRDVFKK